MSIETTEIPQVFHKGEIDIQERAGVRDAVSKYGHRNIRDYMPDQHREFFAQLPMMFVGALDAAGHPWATGMFAKPGFTQSPDDKTLVMQGDVLAGDDLGLNLGVGDKVGLLGIELETRRRNRMNATIRDHSEGAYRVSVDQSFGNCPKYIQRREMSLREAAASKGAVTLENSINDTMKTAIESADTFFIASRTADIGDDPREGVDVSHRGGRPGFIKVEDNVISFPDFSGNLFFNTLGNISLDPRVGLFFPNFETGDAIFLKGRASIIWDPARVAAFEGAERIIEIEVFEAGLAQDIIPLKGDFIDEWPLLRNTGVWK